MTERVHKLTRQIAIHEAGHAVVAHALGINGLRICTFEHGFACGMEVPDDPGPLDEWILAVVTAAGAAAEKACGLEPGEGGDEDWQLVVEHVARWAGLDEPPDPDDILAERFEADLRRVCDTAFAITRHRQNAIERIAEIAFFCGEVDEDTLRTELGSSRPRSVTDAR